MLQKEITERRSFLFSFNPDYYRTRMTRIKQMITDFRIRIRLIHVIRVPFLLSILGLNDKSRSKKII